MNKLRFYTAATLLLLIINVFLLYTLNRKKEDPRDRPRKIVIERLGFSEEQVRQYDSLISAHRKQMAQQNDEVRLLKNELYSTLTQKDKESVADSIISVLGKKQMEIENIHYRHFIDIKNMCKEEQQEKFRQLTKEIAGIFAPGHPQKNK